jgi:hypothetical protein
LAPYKYGGAGIQPNVTYFLQWEAGIVALAVFAAGGALCLKR